MSLRFSVPRAAAIPWTSEFLLDTIEGFFFAAVSQPQNGYIAASNSRAAAAASQSPEQYATKVAIQLPCLSKLQRQDLVPSVKPEDCLLLMGRL